MLLLFLSKCHQDALDVLFLVLKHLSGRKWAVGGSVSLLRFWTLWCNILRLPLETIAAGLFGRTCQAWLGCLVAAHADGMPQGSPLWGLNSASLQV